MVTGGPQLLVQTGMSSSKEGFGESLMSWVQGGCTECLRQNRSSSDCGQPTCGENMLCSTAFHNRKISEESA